MIEVKARPELLSDVQNHIFIEPSFLSIELCKKLISYGEKNKVSDKSNHPGRHEVCGLDDSQEVHEQLDKIWEKSINYFESNVYFVETYLLKKYGPMSYFGRHIDNYISVANKIDRKLSMTVQLSDENDYKGGEVVVEGVTLPKKIGTVIVFPSNYYHEVKSIKQGVRWSLVTWAWGNAF